MPAFQPTPASSPLFPWKALLGWMSVSVCLTFVMMGALAVLSSHATTRPSTPQREEITEILTTYTARALQEAAHFDAQQTTTLVTPLTQDWSTCLETQARLTPLPAVLSYGNRVRIVRTMAQECAASLQARIAHDPLATQDWQAFTARSSTYKELLSHD